MVAVKDQKDMQFFDIKRRNNYIANSPKTQMLVFISTQYDKYIVICNKCKKVHCGVHGHVIQPLL